jgi:hypothetical protein
MLRCRVRLTVPVFLLALLVQVFAPGWAGCAAQADGFASTPECSVVAGGAASRQQTQPSQHHHTDQCCLFCHLPYAFDPASMVVAFAAPVVQNVTWTFGPAFVQSACAGKHARARAPPSFS